MSKKHQQPSKDQSLDFEVAKEMTIEEAVRKDSQIKAGITDQDGVLDRYIKQHKDQIDSQKFETKTLELDTKALDDFIEKQRASLNEELLEASATETELSKATVIETEPLMDKTAPVLSDVEPPLAVGVARDSVLLEQSEPIPTGSKKKGLLLAGLAVAVLGVFAGGYYLNRQSNQTKSADTGQTSQKKANTSKQSLSPAKAEDKQAFEELYASFFTGEGTNRLKNDQFDRLGDLEGFLKPLEGTSDYEAAKTKFDSLKKQVEAIKAINAQFESPIVVDGDLVESQLAQAANLDSLDKTVLSTGNAELDNLLQTAISTGRNQQKERAEAAANQAQAEAQAQAAQQASIDVATAPAIPADTGATYNPGLVTSVSDETSQPDVPVASSAVQYGITDYDPAILQRHLSRVPYDQAVIADSDNPAWTFNEGVLERILEVSRARGYITGNNFIIEKVNIIKGKGYYNMFKPDGTYLFSINAKTGYFVGNGKGYAEDLDY